MDPMPRRPDKLNRPDGPAMGPVVGLDEGQLTALRSVLSKVPEVAFAYLFGSALRGTSFRDVDVAVYLHPCPSSSYERFRVAQEIGRRLERSVAPRREVDVRLLNEAPVLFRYEVLRSGRLLFERDPERRVRYEALVFSSYLDYGPVWARLVGWRLGEDGEMGSRPELIAHLEEMAEALADWERYRANVPLERLRSDRDARNMVFHAMLVTVQAAIDLANLVIAEERLGTPSTYREVFEILAEASVIPVALSEELADLAGFRNVLVHLYWRLDIDRAYEILQQGLAPLRQLHDILRRRISRPNRPSDPTDPTTR